MFEAATLLSIGTAVVTSSSLNFEVVFAGAVRVAHAGTIGIDRAAFVRTIGTVKVAFVKMVGAALDCPDKDCFIQATTNSKACVVGKAPRWILVV